VWARWVGGLAGPALVLIEQRWVGTGTKVPDLIAVGVDGALLAALGD
jgi:hypothetical protein